MDDKETTYTPGEKCPLSGLVVSVTGWATEETTICHGCGGVARFRVRVTDTSPWARLLTHKVPKP